jgi:hypothetical protein
MVRVVVVVMAVRSTLACLSSVRVEVMTVMQ